jgi:hypothetical protein
MFLKIQAAVSLFTCTCMLGATTVPATSIGTVTANGEIQVDGSAIRSNSTLFNGSVVQTSAVRSDVRLADGSQLVLNPDSRMTLYRDHAVLEQGLTMQRNAGKHAVIANGLKVSSETPNGAVLVDIQNRTHMEVAARNGAADVRTPAGDLVARIEPGKALSFDTAPSENISASSIKIAGVLRPVAGHFVLTDALSGVTFQLQGSNLAAYSGTPVQVIGMVASAAPSVPGASRVVDVSEASPQNDNPGNNRDNEGPRAVPPVSYPFFDKSTILFLVVVAEVGVFGGLAAAGTFSSGPSVSHQ